MNYFWQRPVFISMCFLGILFFGIFSFFNIPISLIPEENYPELIIYTPWRGSPPIAVKNEITAKIESAVYNLRGIRNVRSISRSNLSIVEVEFDTGINLDFAELELKEQLKRISNDLPEDASLPYIRRIDPEEFSREPLLRYIILSETPSDIIYNSFMENVYYHMRAIEGINDIQVSGERERGILVSFDRNKLDNLDISILSILDIIRRNSYSIGGSRGEKHGEVYYINIFDGYDNISDIENLILGYIDNNPVFLYELADIAFYDSPPQRISRYNGINLVSVTIIKEGNFDSISLSKKVRSVIHDSIGYFPPDTKIKILDDEKSDIKEKLNDIYLFAFLVFLGLFGIIYFFSGDIKYACLAQLTVVFSVFATIFFVYIFKIQLNILTLSSLAFSIGLLIDNAVVVLDSIIIKKEEGFSEKDAIISGTRDVFFVVFGSTLTTIAVFFAFPFFTGRLRLYYFPVAQVITIALLSSLFVCFTLLPSISYYILPKLNSRKTFFRPLRYILLFCFKYPALILAVFIIILISSIVLFATSADFDLFFSWRDRESLNISITLPHSFADINNADYIASSIEEIVLSKDYDKYMYTEILDNRVNIRISFPEEIEYSEIPRNLKRELIMHASRIDGVSTRITGFDRGSRDDYHHVYGVDHSHMTAWQFRLRGYNLQKLYEIIDSIKMELDNSVRVYNFGYYTSSRYFPRTKSYRLIPKLEFFSKNNLNLLEIVNSFRLYISTHSNRPGKIKISQNEYIIDYLMDTDSLDITDILESNIRIPNNKRYKLSDLFELQEVIEPSTIERENQEYIATVYWSFRGTGRLAQNLYNGIYDNLYLPPGYSKERPRDGYSSLETEEKQTLHYSILIALFIVFIIVLSIFEDIISTIIIFFTYPISAIGIGFAFYKSRFPFDSSAYIGLILSLGIVINLGIILIGHINNKVYENKTLVDAIIKATQEKYRTLAMTIFTTLIGLTPFVIFTESMQTDIWSTLSLSTFGGLISSLIFLPIILPTMYYLLKR